MAAITQTIDNYFAGISEQPDLKKFPGQLDNIENAIPDPIDGLYKRPGSKRISPAEGVANHDAPLPNVQSNGSWFHYYRDETEGAYIGQIASDGTTRIWSCNDGVEKTVHHGAVPWVASTAYAVGNKVQNGANIYVCDTAGTSAGSGGPTGTGANITDGSARWDYEATVSATTTLIKNYLTPSSATATEDLQALTINDTTFLNNRTKPVGTTGTTAATEHTHFAYLELLRTENGRQYSLNAFNNASTQGLKRATRLKIKSDTLAEGQNTGTCPGIGTQVFSQTVGSRKNLIFRITVLGQQGQLIDKDDGSDPQQPSSIYSCSYNRSVTLLHGGEDWETGDETTVMLTQAKGGGAAGDSTTKAQYTIQVLDHEDISHTANIKAVRPAPTPFDAETAVTADTILAGIRQELAGTTISTVVIGNGLYLHSTSPFSIQIQDPDLMRVMHDSVNNIADLPVQCRNGYIVKVANSSDSNADDYYLKFEGNDGRDGPGSWVECAAPGIVKSLDATSMPHVLQRQADGAFLVKKYTWGDREVGDSTTNDMPTFVGQKINKVLFFRNRLAFLSGENVILSRPGELTIPSFFAKTAIAVSAVDPIDISCSSSFPSALFDGIEVAAGLAVFSTNQQFLLSSDAEILNPDTAKLRSISTYNYNKDVPPISLGTTVGYLDNSGKYSRFNEMTSVQREVEPVVVNTSEVVPTLLRKELNLLANSRENGLVLFGKLDSDQVIGYKYINQGEGRIQTSWFKWKLNKPIRYHFIIDDEYFFLDTDKFLQKINIVQQSTDPSLDQDDINYLIHLDNWTTVGSGSYNATTKLTTFANQSDWIDQVTSPNGALVLIDIDPASTRVGRYAECTVVNTDDFTVPGDWSTGTFYIGYLYDYSVKFPKFYATQQQGNQAKSDVNSSLIIHRIKLNFGKSGLYETTLKRVGKLDYTEVYESAFLDDYEVSDAPYLPDHVQTVPVYESNKNLTLELKSTHPAPATLYALSWEGDYSTRNYKRV